jgi:hypothetical protein
LAAGLADDRARFAGLKAAADEAEQQLAQRGARGADFDRDKFERMCVLLRLQAVLLDAMFRNSKSVTL